MDRRNFLRNSGFLTVSVALGGLAGCGGDSGGLAVPAALGSGWKFPQSVASGDPSPEGAVLWTRVVASSADDVTTASDTGDFSIRVKVTEADNSARLGTTTALAGTLAVDNWIPVYAAYDGTVRNKLTGLKPATTYYYQFEAGMVLSRVGRFRTAPAKGASVDQLRLAFMTCQDWSVNHWGAFDYIVRNEDVDLIVHLGDYIYETVGASFQSGAVESRHDLLVLPDGAYESGTSGPRYALTLADYRYLYKKYRTDPRLQAVHERFAFVATWDDHEFSDDCWGDAETYDNGSFNSATLSGDNPHQTARRRSANRAWFEFMPADVRLDESTTSFDTIRLYRDLQWGTLAHLVVTDERLYRADHVVPEATPNPATGAALGSIGSRYVVPQSTRDSFEAAKMAAAGSADPLAPVSILGKTQRDWWKSTMTASPATWKLWCNEVSLLRMQLDGTNAIATLFALQAVSTLANSIQGALPAVGGNAAVAGALVAAMTAGASQATAAAAALAIATAAATAGNPGTAATGAGLTAHQAAIAVAAFTAAAAANGTSAQVAAAARTIAFGYIKPDVQAKGVASSFVQSSGKAAALQGFFTRFLFDCDQWDGYNAERKALMAHLKGNGIQNVVALTGDLHCFDAGVVYDDFDASGGTPVMVDLVTAGISSDSLFTFYADSVGAVNADLATLIYYPLSIPVSGVGTVSLRFNVFDFTMAGHVPTLDELAEQARVPLRGALAAKGVPEASLDATTTAVLTALKADSSFNTDLLGLAQQLAGICANPWIKWAATDAQGYAVVTVTPGRLSCVFKQVNRLVGTAAPSSTVIARTVTATVNAGSAVVTVS